MSRLANDAPIGTRVAYNGNGMHDLHNGDLGTVVGVNDYGSLCLVMDNPRGRELRNVYGVPCHWTTSGSDFDVVEAPAEPTVGGRVRIISNGANGATVNAGDLGTITEVSSYDNNEFYVKMDESRGFAAYNYREGSPDWVFRPRDVEFIVGAAPVVEVTLDSFRLSFLEGAVARAAANGGRHPQQVKEALDELARAEFLAPSKTLEDFQARVVEFAMAAKGRYSWCGEPEAYLTSIGLGHLLPRRMVVKVITEVTVMATPGMTDRQIRTAAREAAAARDAGDFWTEDPTEGDDDF